MILFKRVYGYFDYAITSIFHVSAAQRAVSTLAIRGLTPINYSDFAGGGFFGASVVLGVGVVAGGEKFPLVGVTDNLNIWQ